LRRGEVYNTEKKGEKGGLTREWGAFRSRKDRKTMGTKNGTIEDLFLTKRFYPEEEAGWERRSAGTGGSGHKSEGKGCENLSRL